MKLFYISHWGVYDGLSVSTIYPNLKILNSFTNVKTIHFFSVERDADFDPSAFEAPSKVQHHPIQASQAPVHLLSRGLTFWKFWNSVKQAAQKLQPDQVICRGAMAGIVGYWLHKKMAIPYVVESFEPHADYMLESGVWSKTGIKYRFQNHFEQKIKQTAHSLVTVSHNYLQQLEKEGISSERLQVVPCTVQLDRFQFDAEKRLEKREALEIPSSTTVGVYLGKFGGIYYNHKAFEVFKAAADYFEDFYLILLTPDERASVLAKLKAVGFPTDKAWVGKVLHAEVPHYLSASDFAFSTIKPANCRQFCSPIKDGEYWAMGLPILIPPGIGDDSAIIEREGGGAVFEPEDSSSLKEALSRIQSILKEDSYRQDIRQLAQKHRSIVQQQEVYEQLFLEP